MKVLCFDIESNGLHGDAFAVAGVLMNSKREIVSQFESRCPITGPVDEWVAANVLGPIQDMPETAADGRALRNAFWAWYMKVKPQADMIVAANPYPVEARFLIDCQNDDMAEREFEHPFPYYDLSSLLYSHGFKTPTKRRAFVKKAVHDATGEPHNPLWDAKATAMAALAAAELISQK